MIDTHVETLAACAGIVLNSRFLPGLGDGTKGYYAGVWRSIKQQQSAIIGNSGVFIVKPTNKTDGGTATNLPSFRNTDVTTTRNIVGPSLIDALKKLAKEMIAARHSSRH